MITLSTTLHFAAVLAAVAGGLRGQAAVPGKPSLQAMRHVLPLDSPLIPGDKFAKPQSRLPDGSLYAIAKDGAVVAGQAAVHDLMESCFEDIHELNSLKDPVDSNNSLRPIYEDLIRMKSRLEAMVQYCQLSLKSDELHPIQERLGSFQF